ncbi:DUF5060 domain-containing protein [Exilibacterium tricleocarpae]|uniref:DUF5060 domain-containing protein n=1 Tax=Exilibacterium tricleocarpae TaxID=2591008 RepID=A0A545TLR4_9GAMM|nr:DUF5060 domain-containing protein [Exilibacterium tricleocarpae]TQV78180.1 DUF5060 domain-containing protein [Exilibacterium tricleocarpae]
MTPIKQLACIWLRTRAMLAVVSACLLSACTSVPDGWQVVEAQGTLTPRHEAAFVEHQGVFYLLGGRRVNPVEAFDPATHQWTQRSSTPLELHHFQAVSLGNAIYIIGAMTGGYPGETPVDRVIKYYPAEDRFEFTHEIPESRRRGGAGAVVYNNKIYVVGGITDGHRGGYQPWLDEYDPVTGQWQALPDAPNARDHFQAVVVGDRLYVFAGRRSSQATGETFNLVTQYGNVFDFKQNRWLPVTKSLAVPTPRAGNMAIAWGEKVIIAGGESARQITAHNEIEVYDTRTGTWANWPGLNVGRHGSGLAIRDGYLYTVSGSGKRGGEPELSSVERLKLPAAKRSESSSTPAPVSETPSGAADSDKTQPDATLIHQRWHTLTLSFNGPMTAESATDNPFTDYRLTVTFEHKDTSYRIRGFFAADGDAANTGADAGSVWQARFTPDREGLWKYRAELGHGADIAIDDDPNAGRLAPLAESTGHFLVVPSDKSGRDFRAKGRLVAGGGYFQFAGSGEHWLKGGANSPENFLGFTGFDGTSLAATSAREGEAVRDNNMHHYKPHLRDWRLGDPVWGDNRGKGIIGAVNYLSAMGMNAVYFLTLNLGGDGNDVWPFASATDFERFDCSKLDQWEIVFQHMQSQGILLHLVTQETENERLLDDGDTGRLRKLYYRELIARFGHHLGLVWNLGEENGPADFSPHAQTDAQRKAMANYLSASDPYGHPLVIHTHSSAAAKHEILGPLLGLKALEGVSFQVDERQRVNAEIAEWRQLSRDAGREWLITMDEIGKWHTGALPDSEDPNHDSLRQHALWGAILGGAAGVEWYFGAHYPANDLSSEDWRLRHRLWQLTRIALDFFSSDRRYWDYRPCNERIAGEGAWNGYCGGLPGQEYVIYSPGDAKRVFDGTELSGGYTIQWFDPIRGGGLRQGTLTTLQGGALQSLGDPPDSARQDWVILLSKQ